MNNANTATVLHLTTPLSRKAVLVRVMVSAWTAKKKDKEVTNKVHADTKSEHDSGAYNKMMVKPIRIAAITSSVTKIRTLFYSKTRPWCDAGKGALRILPNALYTEFSNELRVLIREFETEVDKFCANYDSYVWERINSSDGLFNVRDYPTVGQIRGKFKVDREIIPFPDVADFRSDLDQETVDEIRQQVEATSTRAVSDAMQSTAHEIVKLVGHMAEKLAEQRTKSGDTKKWYADTLVENVRELARLLPAFNLTNDSRLTDITTRIERELCVEDAAVLRKNPDAALAVETSANDIVKAMVDFF
jgi:hypothetical protein